MRNFYASLFVVFFLAACSAHVWTNTSYHPRQELVPAYPASSWDSYVKRGGAFHGLE